ncbi:MAG: hypothetical protein CL579_01100 [Alteromonadaceae bacterium]|jgi:hypothetical protein|uniref:DUF3806 domain-containing protein n=2 Tax=Paraglaciecola mesophila TaxID=197222 RepID=K6ZLT5_9ALTE|nr:hypothetical protein [Paraglaciecola mesophila]MAD14672.1 hypothetical protein [Alteromonadaceae bacterium]MBB19047.1 hypothetical protein [Rickettsiales bacterium]GAC24310.1 hypothetical protein GMES_2014 [Paraglaciecola mesophila KMM 241]|tara:strand:- start:12800 stop:13213 length:414 start_codon:yes stop_codon:yes gene_type:complete|eukprot:TRINITY_DN10153_c0_g1_i1.p1 TRINITY_DN10153_c0_g1~~TRINITY_DN10153_c0_g1_i1.p1  ORF type:complete len:138 (+),score=22.07 TRINITY_DN10153_c0_g1_i1:242-655(+)
MQMTQEELTQLMIDSAQNAIETTEQEFGIILDETEQSLSLVDDVILSWLGKYESQALEDSAVFTICNIYGAYVGELFRHKVGGFWKYDESDKRAPYVVLEYAGNTYAFAGICYQRLVNDSQVSVKNYFEQAVANNVQ